MRFALLLASTLALWMPCVALCAESKSAPLTGYAASATGFADAWTGKYPLGMPGEYGSFFDVPEVKAVIGKSVPPAWMKKVLRWTVNTPFQRSGNVLHAFLCKPHDCSDNNAVIYFDLDRHTFQMCVSEFDAKRQAPVFTWVAATARPLPAGACEETIDAYRRFGEK